MNFGNQLAFYESWIQTMQACQVRNIYPWEYIDELK